jgi:hypothetical protein
MSTDRFQSLTWQLYTDGKGFLGSLEQLAAHADRIDKKREVTWGDHLLTFLHLVNVGVKGRKGIETFKQWANVATMLPPQPLAISTVSQLQPSQPVMLAQASSVPRRGRRRNLTSRSKSRR